MAPLGEGVPNTYKQSARDGGDVLWHATIKGQSELAKGISLHMSLKVFDDKKGMDLEEIKQKVAEFKLKTPDPSKLTFKTKIFRSEKDGTQYYMLMVEGVDESYSKFYDSMKHCGTVYKKFMPHITIDKDLYDKINKEGLKPNEVSFDDLTIEHGAGNTVHRFNSLSKSEEGLQLQKKESMQITPEEIDTVEDAGMINKSPVKMIRTKGGFWIAVGRLKGKTREEALAAGSHPAIVKYNLEKQFPDFQPSMMKSEHFADSSIVENHSHFLPEDLKKSGHDIYSVQVGPRIDFHITKHNSKISTVNGSLENNFLVIKNLNIPKQFSKALAGAAVEKALSCESGMKVKI